MLANHCRIDKITRSFCAACRLKKCLALGMDPKLIRKISVTNIRVKKTLRKEQNLQLALPSVRTTFFFFERFTFVLFVAKTS